MMPRDMMERFRQRLAAKSIDMRFDVRTLETVFGELADVIDFGFAQLNDGHYVWTPLDCATLLRQLQAEAALSITKPVENMKVCPRCGHVHQDRVCGMKMGGAPECMCEAEVRA